MTRAEKIAKLGNAIKEYRGRFNEKTGEWMQNPKPSRMAGIVRWAERLKLNVQEVVEKAESFRHINEYDAWIKTL